MNKKDFQNIKKESELDSDLLKALWNDYKGHWNRAHEITQAKDNEPDYDRIHAYLHRKEGDISNARWWYNRLGIPFPKISLDQEWEELVEQYSK